MVDEINNNAAKSTGANSNKLMLYIILGLITVLIIVMIAGILLLMDFGGFQNRSKTPVKSPLIGQSQDSGFFIALGNPFTVNIRAVDGSEYYLITEITLEVTNNQKIKDEVIKRLPQIRDLVVMILHSKTKEKFDNQEGIEQIRNEIVAKTNSVLGEKVKHVYFESLTLQQV